MLPTGPLVSPLAVTVPGGATVINSVVLNGLTHTYGGDSHFVLQAPNGTNYNLLVMSDSTSPGGGGCASAFSGTYTILDPISCANSPVCGPVTFPAGSYSQSFSTWTNGNAGLNNTPLEQIPIASGTWTLYVYDWYGQLDNGTLTSWDICFGSPTVPSTPTVAPTLVSPANGQSLFGPGITLTWSGINCATGYDVDVDGVVYSAGASTSYVYTSSQGMHTWMVRGVNGAGAGPWSASRTFNDLGPAPTPCNGPSLTTLFTSNNGGSVGGQVFFDVNVTNAAGITVSQLDTNTSLAIGTLFSMSIYTKAGTFVGFENNSGAWTLAASGGGISAGQDQPTLIEFTDFALPPGVTGFALIINGASHRYTGTAAIPPPTFFSNADLSITGGKALNVPWSGTPFSPRMWNGSIRYNCTYAPTAYCTAGTSTNGCVPSISANNQPSVSFANSCVITVANVEGLKSGIVFYGINNSGFSPTPWSATSTSFLCVKAPTQRMTTTNSGGTSGLCDGALVQDWNAFQMANPTSLGNPFAAGNKAYAQGWYRDPPAPKTTNLSDAIEMTLAP